MKTFNVLAVLIGALVVVGIAAIVWRTANESETGYTGEGILVTVDYVSHCQTMTEECYAAADHATQWALAHRRLTKACLAQRPSRRAVARGALIWLNAHVEVHPLPVEEGITRAADAIWPCKI